MVLAKHEVSGYNGAMMKPSDQIRQAIEGSKLTRYAIAKATGVPESTLSKFVNGKFGLTLDTVDRLSGVLGLSVVVKHQATKATPKRKSRQKTRKRLGRNER
jgi:plasmid maintenance system antidote protein VapI